MLEDTLCACRHPEHTPMLPDQLPDYIHKPHMTVNFVNLNFFSYYSFCVGDITWLLHAIHPFKGHKLAAGSLCTQLLSISLLQHSNFLLTRIQSLRCLIVASCSKTSVWSMEPPPKIYQVKDPVHVAGAGPSLLQESSCCWGSSFNACINLFTFFPLSCEYHVKNFTVKFKSLFFPECCCDSILQYCI